MVAALLDWLSRGMTLREAARDLWPVLVLLWGVLVAGVRRYAVPWMAGLMPGVGRLRGRWSARRRFGSRLRQIRRFDANPRLLFAYVARRVVGLAIVGSSLLMNAALFTSDHIRRFDGRPVPGLRWELGFTAALELFVVAAVALAGADTVERIEDWADPARGRARLRVRYRKKGRR